MDAKITLSFDAEVITKAKAFAEKNNTSMSRLAEYFFNKIAEEDAKTLEAYPIADWVLELMGNKIVYNTKKHTNFLEEYYESKYTSASEVNEPLVLPTQPKKSKK